jgi:hypothetical protein
VALSLTNGFSADVGRVNAVVADEARANSAKLAKANADERHLFVWLNHSHSGAELAVSTGLPLPGSPVVPDTIDCVWLATQGVPDLDAIRVGEVGVLRLWRVRPPAAWEDLSLRPLEQSATARVGKVWEN